MTTNRGVKVKGVEGPYVDLNYNVGEKIKPLHYTDLRSIEDNKLGNLQTQIKNRVKPD